MLWSIPKKRREVAEFSGFKRKLVGLVVLEFIVILLALLLYAGSANHAYPNAVSIYYYFGRLHASILAISPVYISFSLLEMLQSFIHGPRQTIQSIVLELSSVAPMGDGSPSQIAEVSNMHESDFEDSDPVESTAHGTWLTFGKRTKG